MTTDQSGMLAVASIVVPFILLAIYFLYDQRKHKKKKS